MMKKRILNYVSKGTITVALLLLFPSCIGYYGAGYDDGIYGESSVRYVYERPEYERPEQRPSQGSYKAYLQEKANGYNAFQYEMQQPSYTPFADVNNYRTPADNQKPTYNSYAGWGENPRETSVTIYNNYGGLGYSPFYCDFPYYWGAGAWYPPYRVGWSISIGSYPYYGGYYGFYGSYYRPYYRPYYREYYYGGNYSPRRYYADGYYYENRNYSSDRRYIDSGRNYNYNNNNRSSSRNYDAGRYNGSYNNSPQRQVQPHYRSEPSINSPSYNSNRSYDSGRYSAPSSSGSGSSNGGSSRGTSRRSY